MQKWEYQKIEYIGGNTDDILGMLNQAGTDGWEYCGSNVFPVTGENRKTGEKIEGMLYIYWLKRPAALVQAAKQIDKAVLLHG